jgi:hypothetical protein
LQAKSENKYKKMQSTYPIKIQAICAKGQKPRLYLSVPMALAAAINLNPHDEVQWELIDRNELHLIRLQPSPPTTKRRATKNSTQS